MKHRVALVGSSGGGAAALGQFDAVSLLNLAESELGEAGLELTAVQFVACSEPLDTAKQDAPTTLWVLNRDHSLVVSARGTLSEVNAAAQKQDVKIAAALRCDNEEHNSISARNGNLGDGDGQASLLPLHALVAISCDIRGVNRQTFTAARDCRAPIVGTGGSSLGEAIAMGCLLVGSSGGSVATTHKSKVVSYAAGLANHFGIRYDAGKALSLPLAPAATFGGCVPSYVGVLVLSGVVERAKQQGVLMRPPHDEGFFSEEDVDHVIASVLLALPAVAGAVAARQVCTTGDMAMVAGVIAGCLCSDNILASLLAGTCAGYSCSKLTAACLAWGVPATSLSFYATLPSGLISGSIVRYCLPVVQVLWALLASTHVLLGAVTNTWTKGVIGAAMGYMMCYGSKVGWYHRIFLPIIVLELAAGGGSIWGAIDLCALCMVAAGLCAAHLLRPKHQTDIPLARRGFRINLCFGDFIEAAYPFMERCSWCNTGGYIGSALSGAVLAVVGVRSSAYLPLPLAFAICDEPLWLVAATSAAFLPAFLCGVWRGGSS